MDVSFGEMLMLAVLALVIFGPERLPGIARSVGQTLGRVRREASATFEALRDETELSEFRELGSDLQREREEWRRLTRFDASGDRGKRSLSPPAGPTGPPSYDAQAT